MFKFGTEIKIANKKIGDDSPCFVIAEAGSNHNGNLRLAKKLIDIAATAGADAVKFQVFRAEKLYVSNAGKSDYLKNTKTINEIIRSMEMPYHWLPKLAAYCKKSRILFLCSVFDEESANIVNPYVAAHKIASYELNHLPLIRHIALLGKPMIISTGASTIQEIRNALNEIKLTKNRNVCLMQCTASYPAPADSLNLNAIPVLKKMFHVPVGLSDHSRDSLVGPLGAVALGANLLEKHFTLSNTLEGPDHRFALEPDELKQMVVKMRELPAALGSGKKEVHQNERELFKFAKRSIQAIAPVKKGEIFTEKNIAILRPGKRRPGLAPKHWNRVLGKKARRDFKAGNGIFI